MLKRNKLTWIRWTVTYWFRNSFLLNEKCLYKNLKIFLMSWFFRIYQEFSRILEKFHFSISISRHFHFTFHSRSRSWDIFISLFTLDLDIKAFSFHFSFSKLVNHIFISLFTSRNEWTRFSFHFSLLKLPIPTLAGHWHFKPSVSSLRYEICGNGCISFLILRTLVSPTVHPTFFISLHSFLEYSARVRNSLYSHWRGVWS